MAHLKAWFRTVHYGIESPRIPEAFDGFRIAHLSDLHGAVYGAGNNRLVQRICGEKPHMVVMTGDMADNSEHSCSNLLGLCGRLLKWFPVYYVPGNHEQSMKEEAFSRLLGQLKDLGVTVLVNQWCTVSRKGAYVRLYGLVMAMQYYKDPMRQDYVRGIRFSARDVRKALGKADPSCFGILLCHNPLYYPSYRDWGADLTLSGHIHGGIIRIPGIGGVLSPDVTLFPKYDGGHFIEKGRHLVVSRGLGNHFLMRVMNPAELVVVTLGKRGEGGRGNFKKALDISPDLFYPIHKSISYKPLTGTSTCLEHAQRVAGGGIAAVERAGNGPVRAN